MAKREKNGNGGTKPASQGDADEETDETETTPPPTKSEPKATAPRGKHVRVRSSIQGMTFGYAPNECVEWPHEDTDEAERLIANGTLEELPENHGQYLRKPHVSSKTVKPFNGAKVTK